MADLVDLLHQISGWAGGVGAAAVGEAYRRFRSSEKAAKSAQEFAKNAQEVANNAQKSATDSRKLFVEIRKIVEDGRLVFENTKHGLRLELDQFRSDVQKKLHELEERELRLVRGSRPDVMSVEELQRQIDQIRGRVEEVKVEIGRDRDRVHSVERDIAETTKEEARWKADLNRSLGSIETQIEILMEAANRR